MKQINTFDLIDGVNYDIERHVKLIYDGVKVEKKLCFKEIDYETSKEMIIKNHYSHKWNTAFGKINIGVFENDELLGVAVFGNLMNPNSFKNFNDDFEKDSVIELNRLWVDDRLGGNTETILMKASFDIIRKKYKHIKAIQSFADGRLGCGTIYKAMNFNYYGYSETLFYENIENGETYHKVPMENTARPDGMIKLNYMWVKKILKPFKVKTYKYIYPLYKDVKIKYQEQEYPKYDKGLVYLDDYEHRKELVKRAFVLSYILGYDKEFDELKKHVSLDDIQETIKERTILEIAKNRKVEEKLKELENEK